MRCTIVICQHCYPPLPLNTTFIHAKIYKQYIPLNTAFTMHMKNAHLILTAKHSIACQLLFHNNLHAKHIYPLIMGSFNEPIKVKITT